MPGEIWMLTLIGPNGVNPEITPAHGVFQNVKTEINTPDSAVLVFTWQMKSNIRETYPIRMYVGLGKQSTLTEWKIEVDLPKGWQVSKTDFPRLTVQRSEKAKAKLGTVTFVTATDGNHGRGVAWAAKLLGHKAVVYLPEGSSQERLNNIRALGAEAEITKFNYDGAVRLAYAMSRKHGWVLVQDTAWSGYEEIPTWIMQGYTTMAQEITAQLNGITPTHLFLQAGVGSMAGAVLGYFAALWQNNLPVTVICEPDKAACLYKTAAANDGTLHKVTGRMNSMMAGLCCGEPCTVSWDIINNFANAFIACSDDYAASGMRLLGMPQSGDARIVSGESGAVTAGVLAALMQDPELAQLRNELGLDENSRVLLISTEGATDKVNYLKVLSGKWKPENK